MNKTKQKVKKHTTEKKEKETAHGKPPTPYFIDTIIEFLLK